MLICQRYFFTFQGVWNTIKKKNANIEENVYTSSSALDFYSITLIKIELKLVLFSISNSLKIFLASFAIEKNNYEPQWHLIMVWNTASLMFTPIFRALSGANHVSVCPFSYWGVKYRSTNGPDRDNMPVIRVISHE